MEHVNNTKGLISKIYSHLIGTDMHNTNDLETMWEDDIGIRIEQNIWNKLGKTQLRKTVPTILRDTFLNLLH